MRERERERECFQKDLECFAERSGMKNYFSESFGIGLGYFRSDAPNKFLRKQIYYQIMNNTMVVPIICYYCGDFFYSKDPFLAQKFDEKEGFDIMDNKYLCSTYCADKQVANPQPLYNKVN